MEAVTWSGEEENWHEGQLPAAPLAGLQGWAPAGTTAVRPRGEEACHRELCPEPDFPHGVLGRGTAAPGPGPLKNSRPQIMPEPASVHPPPDDPAGCWVKEWR